MTKWWYFSLDRLIFCLLIFLWQGARLDLCVLHTKLPASVHIWLHWKTNMMKT